MKRIVSLVAVLGTMGYAASASAIGTAANTQIDNTANATFTINGAPVTESSDQVTFFVDEVLDVDVTGGDIELVGTDGTDDTQQIVTFTVSNPGNGQEDYKIDVNLAGGLGGDQFDPDSPAIGALVYIDNDGNGIIDAGDTPFDPAVDTLPLDADETVQLLVVVDIPNGRTSGDTADVDLTATSTTVINNGTPGDAAGTVYPNAGDGGVDAVVGTTTAVDTDTDTYIVNQLTIDLLKEAEKVAGLGDLGLVDGATVVQVPGDTIRYRLTFTVSGDGTLDDVLITDAIPTDLTYVVGSIRTILNGGTPGTPSDAVDADEAFKGPIPVGNPDAGAEGIVVDVETLVGGPLAATTTPPVDYTIVIEFDTIIPAI